MPGRHDRTRRPEGPVCGEVGYMSSENTVRELDVTRYLERYS